ncbi:alcohol dehydrogenase [Caballeronia pedi]|uniref:Alcohol dehydrogenase n=1 Tax=Caballeronia pedi TaxID=1777141 RepID=A0A158E005_9BURK|nr:NADP-dependent oxidoreductase [Caballeronia pedi]SAL00093.1 alcohol dehydrogenase [Caballeronia pedi]
MRNRQWVLASHAQGTLNESLWSLAEADVLRPASGQILVKTLWLSVDPYMRGRLNAGAGMQLGSLMQGGGVGEVVESNHPGWKIGDIAEGPDVGWQDYAVLTPDLPGASKVNKVDTRSAPPQAALSWLGMPGLTAYFAMLDVGRPRPGDTVVVSAAAGAVGQIAGQLARLAGCRVVGIAGSDRKLDWCKTIGFDETINYKAMPDLAAEVGRCCPGGVNVFFDGTGGPIHDAVMKNLATGARVAIVGRVAVANNPAGEDVGLRASSRLIATRAVVQGFVVYDWWNRRDEALQRLAAWHASGELKFREDVMNGLENVPRAFMRMMGGENFGKQLVQL